MMPSETRFSEVQKNVGTGGLSAGPYQRFPSLLCQAWRNAAIHPGPSRKGETLLCPSSRKNLPRQLTAPLTPT